jgi:GNAT superfamily N-acetyltransferase
MFNVTSYKKFVSLKNGSRVLLRFLKDGDQANLTDLFQSAPPEDNRYLTYFSTDSQHFAIFLRNLNYFEKIPLTAMELENKRMIAAALLSRGNGSTKHIGEVHCVFVARPFQGLGLGSFLLEELISLAGKADIICLEAKIVTEQKNCIRAFRNRGFESKTLLENHFCCRDGKLHDVLFMTLPLTTEKEEF